MVSSVRALFLAFSYHTLLLEVPGTLRLRDFSNCRRVPSLHVGQPGSASELSNTLGIRPQPMMDESQWVTIPAFLAMGRTHLKFILKGPKGPAGPTLPAHISVPHIGFSSCLTSHFSACASWYHLIPPVLVSGSASRRNQLKTGCQHYLSASFHDCGPSICCLLSWPQSTKQAQEPPRSDI